MCKYISIAAGKNGWILISVTNFHLQRVCHNISQAMWIDKTIIWVWDIINDTFLKPIHVVFIDAFIP